MQCLNRLGEWQQLSQLSERTWDRLGEPGKQQLAPMLTQASWFLQDWRGMAKYMGHITDRRGAGSVTGQCTAAADARAPRFACILAPLHHPRPPLVRWS